MNAKFDPCKGCYRHDCSDCYVRMWKQGEKEITRLRKALEYIAEKSQTAAECFCYLDAEEALTLEEKK